MFRDTFYGQKISNYGRQNGRVDYHALVASFDAVLCNGVLGYRDAWDDWEQVSGFVDNSEAIEEIKAKLEEVEEELKEATENKAQAERDYDDLCEAYDNTEELLEQFESFEYEANEVLEKLRWNNYETPSGEDLEADTLEREIEGLDFWSMREDIENHQSLVEEQRDEAEEAFDAFTDLVEELTKEKKELEEALDTLECEDTTETEYYQYFIISDDGARILEQEAPSEAVWYNAELDIYVWGVTHFGTAWDYVLTSIPCETYEQEAERLEAEAKVEEEAKAKAEAMTEEERAEQEAEDLEDLLDLWENDEPEELEEIEEEPTEDTFEEALEEVYERVKRTPEGMTPTTWEAVVSGEVKTDEVVAIGKPVASEHYGCTNEGWKGEVMTLYSQNGIPTYFDGKTISGGSYTTEGEEFSKLDIRFFDLYRVNGEGVR